MKLTKFNKTTLPKQWGGGASLPKISFGKSGVISFNKSACALLDIAPGDKIQLAQDEDDLANWYISKDKDGFELRGKDFDKIGSLTFNHKTMVTSFFESFEMPVDKSRTFLISGEATTFEKTKYWGILVTNS